MKYTPRPNQREALKFLVSRPAAGLFARVGSGKTATMLEAFRQLKSARAVERMLVLAPLRVVYHVWPEEIEKWSQFNDMTVAIAHGSPDKRLAAFEKRADVTLLNYDGVPWVAKNVDEKLLPDMVVADESTRLKKTSTQRFKSIRPLLPGFKRRYAMTGTPAPNGLEDLFGQVYYLDMGKRLGRTLTRYRLQYFDQHPWRDYQWDLKPEAEEAIYEKLSDLVLRQPDPEGLPPIVRQTIRVDLPSEAREIYNELEHEFFVKLAGGEITAANAAVKAGKLRQVCNGFLYHADGSAERIHDAKVDALADLFEQLGGDPALVAYVYREDAAVLRDEFDIPSFSEAKGQAAKKLFAQWNASQLGAMSLHPASAGHGLNLQSGGRDIIFFGADWNLELHEQAIGRLHRMNQRDTVYVHEIVAADTIEEVVLHARRAKDQTQQALMKALLERRPR